MILTLNMSFPDFDFGDVQPTDFTSMDTRTAMNRINKCLSDVALLQETFLTDLWAAIDSAITLQESDVYSYQPQDGELMSFLTQTLTEGSAALHKTAHSTTPSESSLISERQPATTIWSFNYFFVNKTAKRILLFTCVESMRSLQDLDEVEEVVPAVIVDASEEDFDLDPAAATAGGIPVSIA